MDGVRR
jgi:transcription initiation factor TFIIIB Brf1 subunit/transcription initiation factor TFIIB